jgi:hypothetical protein
LDSTKPVRRDCAAAGWPNLDERSFHRGNGIRQHDRRGYEFSPCARRLLIVGRCSFPADRTERRSIADGRRDIELFVIAIDCSRPIAGSAIDISWRENPESPLAPPAQHFHHHLRQTSKSRYVHEPIKEYMP